MNYGEGLLLASIRDQNARPIVEAITEIFAS